MHLHAYVNACLPEIKYKNGGFEHLEDYKLVFMAFIDGIRSILPCRWNVNRRRCFSEVRIAKVKHLAVKRSLGIAFHKFVPGQVCGG